MISSRRLKRLSLLASCFAVLFGSVPASALTTDQYYVEQNMLHYGQETAVCSASSVLGSTVRGADNMAKIWNYLVDKGLSNEQAAGVLGNIAIESGHSYSPTRQEDDPISGKGGWGLVQWTAGRRTALVAYIREKDSSLLKYESDTVKYGGPTTEENGYRHINVPLEDNDTLLALELDYLYTEAMSRKVTISRRDTSAHGSIQDKFGGMTEWEAVRTSSSIREASNIWLLSFERPKVQSTSHQDDRVKSGEAIYKKMTGQSASGTDDPTSTGDSVINASYDCSDGYQSQGFEGTVVDYVLPDFHAEPYTGKDNAMDAYVVAADKAKSSGYYVGNGANPYYADCGGFVTLLIRNSGFDATYNYGGKIADGASNTVKQRIWLEENWQDLGSAATIDTGTLQPGDVFIGSGHTFVYIGDVPGINSNIASASNKERVPMAGQESLTDTGSQNDGHWYRKKSGVAV